MTSCMDDPLAESLDFGLCLKSGLVQISDIHCSAYDYFYFEFNNIAVTISIFRSSSSFLKMLAPAMKLRWFSHKNFIVKDLDSKLSKFDYHYLFFCNFWHQNGIPIKVQCQNPIIVIQFLVFFCIFDWFWTFSNENPIKRSTRLVWTSFKIAVKPKLLTLYCKVRCLDTIIICNS